MRSDWRAFLEAKDCPDWLHLENDPRAVLVKEGHNRQVWRVDLEGRSLFAKVIRPRSWATRWVWLIRGNDAEGERRRADYAARYGIDAVVPIASARASLFERKPAGLLLTTGMPGTEPLSDLWTRLLASETSTRRVRNAVINVVARLVAHAHQNGFQHLDLHPGNILVYKNNDGFKALFVDLHEVNIGRPVRQRDLLLNLAQINQWFRVRGCLSDRMRFLDRYLHWHDCLAAGGAYGRRILHDRRTFLRELEEVARYHANYIYTKWDKRIFKTGRYFARLDLDAGWRANVFLRAKSRVPGSRASEISVKPSKWRQWLQEPSTLLDITDHANMIKVSKTAVVCRTSLAMEDGSQLDIVCKQSFGRNSLKRLQNSVRTSRAMQTWKKAHALLNRQIPTARPLAVLEKRRWGVRTDSLIITEYIENARDLDTVLSVHMRELSPARQRRFKLAVSEALVTVLRRFHEWGFMHRDFKAPNIIVQWNTRLDERPRVLLVDLDGVRRVRRPRRKALLRALMRLNVSLDHCPRVTRTDRLRFLRLYFERPGRPWGNWKPIWRKLAAMSDVKREMRNRNHRRNRKINGG